MKIPTYAETIDFLYNLRLFGTKLGLENTIELARLAGAPERCLRFIHVAGTNGKGSTCAMIESIYREQGYRTGLFTSPHLVSFTERIQVNRVCIPEQEVARLAYTLRRKLGADPGDWPIRPTFFEFVTVIALLYFLEQRSEIVIWETGLGGRLDATNIVTPLASVITNIQYDHERWLGSTLEQIAVEKAGIIKPGVPVITGAREPAALDVIRRTAREAQSPLIEVRDAGELPVSPRLRGDHQRMNAAVAVATVQAVRQTGPVSGASIIHGLENVDWPGRLQLLRLGEREILLDGAHNPDGARTLAAALQQDFRDRECTLILGLLADKSWESMCEILVPLAARVLLVPVHSERSVDVSQLKAFCTARWPEKPVTASAHVAEAIQHSATDPFVVAAGSLLLIGEAMESLGITSSRSERALNEWDAANAASLPGVSN